MDRKKAEMFMSLLNEGFKINLYSGENQTAAANYLRDQFQEWVHHGNMTLGKLIYKDKTYDNIYELSEALGQEGIFIPLSIDDEALAKLNVIVTHEEEPLEVMKQRKITELKYQRDKAEVKPIEYNGNFYDYDEKARDRINAAIIALSLQGEGATIDWTTADNQDVKVTANDLRMVIAAVAVRSNALHTAYRKAKEQVEAAQNKEEVEAIILNV